MDQQRNQIPGSVLGSTMEFERKSFSSIKNEIETVLKKWKQLAPILSYRGRVFIVNNLCASMLWHKVICTIIDDSVVKEILKLFVAFFLAKHTGCQSTIYIYRLMMVGKV